MNKKNKSRKAKNGAKIFLFLCFLFIFSIKISGFSLIFVKNEPHFAKNTLPHSFNSGEKLKYKISYGRRGKRGGPLFAAHATLALSDTTLNDSTSAYSIVAKGQTTRFFSIFMRVHHHYRSYLEINSLKTIQSSMIIREGKYTNFDSVEFDTINKNNNVNDILGAFYKLRNIHPTALNNLDTIFFSYYYSGKTYNSHILNLGEEIIDTKFGKINTIKCAPLLEKGRIFKTNTGAIVWVSNDKAHVPIKLEIPILVGSLYVDLVSSEKVYFNLKE